MDFNNAISLIADILSATGTTIDTKQYDGAIIKKLEASNTLDDGRTTNQTHIAITGVQMDIFPYLRADGYFNDAHSDADLKKYFIPQIPVCIHQSNYDYLGGNAADDGLVFANGIIEGKTSVVRSKRKNQADQIQVSLINFDSADFVAFRHLLHSGSYLILLKRAKQFKYDAFGVIPGKGINSDGGLQALNNQFFKLATNTVIDASLATQRSDGDSGRLTGGTNIILYGVPGAGKSWTIKNDYCNDVNLMERLVFHPDYTYSDFVGQIMPTVAEDGSVSYVFTPGPFTKLVRKAYLNPDKMFYLVIEEINRGNAPAIFGDIFQLLDRNQSGSSEYEITNADIARIVYEDDSHKVSIPSNMSILCTMNTSDQNVFTLDTAFQRRWNMRLIKNRFQDNQGERAFAETKILDTSVSWEHFFTEINKIVLTKNIRMTSSEDKRLGTHFVAKEDLLMGDGSERQISRFPEKVLKYLWDDAFKFTKEDVFDLDKVKSLEDVIELFVSSEKDDRFLVFKENIFNTLVPKKSF